MTANTRKLLFILTVDKTAVETTEELNSRLRRRTEEDNKPLAFIRSLFLKLSAFICVYLPWICG